MWTSRLFWRFFTAYLLVIVLFTCAIVIAVSGWHNRLTTERVDRRLRVAALLVRNQMSARMSTAPTEELQTELHRLGELTGVRITLVNMQGLVLADSGHEKLAEVLRMDNHLARPEIAAARTHGEGITTRVSNTLEQSMRYFALRAENPGDPGVAAGFVRVAVPMASVEREISQVQRLIGFFAVLAMLSVVAITYWIVTRIVRPVNRLKEAADAISQGDYSHQVTLPYRDELSQLGDSFNRMSRVLASQVAQLRTGSERLETVLAGMNEGVIAMDERHRVLFANVAAGRLLGFSTEHSEGRKLLENVRSHELDQLVAATLAVGRAKHIRIDVGTPTRNVNVTASAMPGSPCPGVVLVMRDDTELRRLESVRQEFVANVSHELKTPLSSIKAYAETLRRGAMDDQDNRLRFVTQIEQQADRLQQLIMDMLSLARIETGKEAFDIEAVDLDTVVQASLDYHRPTADAKRIALVSEPWSEAVQVKADAEGVRQILDNLIDNSIKYTPENGQITVRWSIRESTVLIDVDDTGIGISPEDHPRLFERFFRVDKARSRELGGTGLGLSIVKHLAMFFGGSVRVNSQPGKGSTFTVTLPLARD
jgi:two-component system phosphate regulon sensor histidine kinase PhoR